VFAAALIYLPPVHGVFGTAALDPVQLAFLPPFPAVVWCVDELWRWRAGAPHPDGTFGTARPAGGAKR
jgi:hypothetical protein